MSDLLQLVVSEGASDLHIRVGTSPTIRVHGILHRVEGPILKPEDTEELMRSITSEDHIQHVRERGGADFGFAFGDMARFRVSVFKEKGNFGDGPAADPQQDADDGADRPAAFGQGAALQAARPGAGDRPHRLGQDDHARLHDQHHQRGARRGPHRHHRGPDRVLPQAQEGDRHPARDRRGRAELRRGAAPRAAPGPGRRSGRRNARPGDDRRGDHGGGNRALGVRHAAHHRRGQDDRPRRQRVPQQPAGANPHPAVDGDAGGDLAVAHPARRQAGTGGYFRDHGQHALHRRADPRQQDVPHPVRHPDRRQVRHGDAGQLPD